MTAISTHRAKAATPNAASLTIAAVGKTYANGTVALSHVSLELGSGEIVAVVGGSGCGKSTLLRIVAGLDRPSAGSIAVDGSPVSGPHPGIGIVFQEPRLLPWLTVGDNVAFGLTGLDRAERRQIVERCLEDVGLAGYGDRWPRELSGGQAQRIAIARALAPAPSVLLLDEPFSALDAFTRADLQQHLIALWAEHRPTMLIVTHDIEEALILADRVIVMMPRPGRISAAVNVTLKRPRDRVSHAFEDAKRAIFERLGYTLDAHDHSQ